MKLERKEKDVLVGTIEQAIEGHRESKSVATSDPVFESPEQLVEYMSDTDDTIDILNEVRIKVLANDD